MDIAEFLTRRLDEDEQTALLAAEAGRRADPRHQWAVEPFVPSSEGAIPANTWVVDRHEIGVAVVNGGYAADHIARHDPEHVLREVKAKRTLLKDASDVPTITMRRALRCLAAAYADHPDYNPAWDLASG